MPELFIQCIVANYRIELDFTDEIIVSSLKK